jgi:hypothetical protein
VQEELLATHPTALLRVYTIWVARLDSDTRDARATRVMPDPRVDHFWDTDHQVARWFTAHQPWSQEFGPIAWDVFYLYGSEASWDEVPQPLISTGCSILRARGQLQEKMLPLLG